ncbi:MAG: tetratricopeptide repeat protein [Candidatus Wallbacteria bacterium]|nr:tetratricopeptide repeat protein [Candidatus Wallbacteria bacterium]
MLRRVVHCVKVVDGILGRTLKSACSVAGVRGLLYAVAIAAVATRVFDLGSGLFLDAAASHRRGMTEMRSEQYTEGLQDLKRAARLSPKSLDYLLSYSEALLVMGEPEKAIDTLRRAWSLEPSRWTMLLMGCAYRDLKLYQAAIGCFTEARSVQRRGGRWDQESWEDFARRADSHIAQCFIRMDEPERAVALLGPGIASSRSNLALHPEPHFWLGVANWMTGDKERALDQWQEAVMLDPSDTGSLYNISCYHAVRGHPLQALAFLEQAVDRGFTDPEYFELDSDMDSIRNLPQFQRLAQRVRERAAGMAPVGPRSPTVVAELVAELKSRRYSQPH